MKFSNSTFPSLSPPLLCFSWFSQIINARSLSSREPFTSSYYQHLYKNVKENQNNLRCLNDNYDCISLLLQFPFSTLSKKSTATL